MTQLNLDQLSARYAQKIVNDGQDGLENLITKTLGVLQAQGVYACMLFLFSRTGNEKKIAPSIRGPLFRLLQDKDKENGNEIPGFQDKNVPANDAEAKTALAFYSDHVCNNLDTLLLVKELYEQTLIYARYGAKAVDK